MRVFVQGKVVKIGDPREYTSAAGEIRRSVDVYLRNDGDEVAAADRVTVPVDMAPAAVGEVVGYWCDVKAYAGKYGPYVSVRAVERVKVARPASATADPA